MAATGVIVVAAGAAAFMRLAAHPGGPGRGPALQRFLAAWSQDDWASMTALSEGHPAQLTAVHQQLVDSLQISRTELTPGSGQLVHVSLTLRGLGVWRYDTTVPMQRQGGAWLVRWSPQVAHPDLGPGLRLGRIRTVPARAPILAGSGQPLATDGPTVAIGLEPRRIKDPAATLEALNAVLPVDQAALAGALARPGLRPDEFVPAVELARGPFDALRNQLEPIPGVVFQARTGRVVADAAFGVPTLGRTGPVTAEQLARLGPTYQAGDPVGQTGLEGAFQSQLAGQPSGEVDLLDDQGQIRSVLYRFAGLAPRPVVTTLDPAVQDAAERSLAGVGLPAAIVVLDAGTGELRAVVSHPAEQAFNRALAGRYPPGSTFKVITTAALLRQGISPGQPVACPPAITVGGKRFTNIAGEGGASLTFADAFAQSCNTAFVGLARQLPVDALATASQEFGFGAPGVDLGLTTSAATVPPPADTVEQVADAIGQGNVVASPLVMAEVAATVAAGSWHPPVLVKGLNPGPAARPLDSGTDAVLRQLMTLVVQKGTGRLAAAAGPDVAGKTGTAEFGTATPPQSHAWFIGFRGTVAFAVIVEGGGVGGQVAAPIAARFLAALPPPA